MGLIIDFAFILSGALIILVTIVKLNGLFKTVIFLPGKSREITLSALQNHRFMMYLFIVGYVKVSLSFFISFQALSEVFVAAIFFFGAVLLLHGVIVQSRMISQMKETIEGILPICSYCKKVRVKMPDRDGQEIWQSLETYLSQKLGTDLSHGICPDCITSISKGAEGPQARE